jgi:thiol-disulfide isomerase/thioredoxin
VTELTLYYRPGCHLCDDLRQELLEFQPENGKPHRFRLREIDIDADPDLRARYGVLIPVLCLGEQEICHFHLNPVALKQALEGG